MTPELSLAAARLAGAAARPRRPQVYVIEVDEIQAGLVSRRDGERHFTFLSAGRAFDALDGRRFATPLAAERAALALHRGGAPKLAA